MQLRGLLVLGLVLGTEASHIARFRAAPFDAKLVRRASDTGSSESTAEAASTVVQVVTASSAAADTPSSTENSSDSSTSANAVVSSESSGSGSSSSSSAADVTVTKTVTVSNSGGGTITKSTTILTTITSTVVVTSTTFKTATVTSSGDTATSTVYETSTQWANQKRAINLAPRTIGDRGIVIAEPMITEAPQLDDDDEEFDLLRPREMMAKLAKRDTVTVTTAVTVGDSSDKTVTKAVTRTVISTISSASKLTKTITETEQADASTTVTVTSTLVVTSTKVTTNVVQTATVAPSGTYGSDSSSSTNSSGGGGGSSSSSGLSTGAKAGIGAGAGVVGLVALALLFWCCFKRRNKPSKSELDDMFGSSEVPVGPSAAHDSTARISTHMSQISPTLPNVTPVKAPEGYRGTALGDGRAGYAKPKPFGAAYAPASVSPEHTYSRTATTVSGGDDHMEIPPPNAVELGNDGHAAKWHQPEAAEIDGNQVTSPRGSSPPENVYEMPSQQYR